MGGTKDRATVQPVTEPPVTGKSGPIDTPTRHADGSRLTSGTTVAVRLSADDVELLDGLTKVVGEDRSTVMREALQAYDVQARRDLATAEYLTAAWAEHSDVDEQAIAAARKYFE